MSQHISKRHKQFKEMKQFLKSVLETKEKINLPWFFNISLDKNLQFRFNGIQQSEFDNYRVILYCNDEFSGVIGHRKLLNRITFLIKFVK